MARMSIKATKDGYVFTQPIQQCSACLLRSLFSFLNVRPCKAELISDILLSTLAHGRPRVGRPGRNYIQQLETDTGCSLEDLPEAMDARDGWRERELGKSVRAV